MNRKFLTGLLAGFLILGVVCTAEATILDWDAITNGTTEYSSGTSGVTTPSVVDIGDLFLSDTNATYEFIVNGLDIGGSSTLLGNRTWGGDTAIKFEQWNNTQQYGVTDFGVADYSFGVNTNFNTDVYLAFTTDGSSTSLFVNGVYESSVAFGLNLTGNVGVGGNAHNEAGTVWSDIFTGEFIGFAAYNGILDAETIALHSDAYFAEPVPEPATIFLMGLGLLGIVGIRKRKNI